MVSLFFIFLLLPRAACTLSKTQCSLERSYTEGYYHDGDLIIGGVLSLTGQNIVTVNYTRHPEDISSNNAGRIPMSKSYQQVLALVFAVQKINKDPHFLPNLSLGFRLYDDCFSTSQNRENVISLLSERDKLTPVLPPPYTYGSYGFYGHPSYGMMAAKGSKKAQIFPNYNCQGAKKMVAVLGGLMVESSVGIANMLGPYKVPQVSYGPFDPLLDNPVEFPFLHQIYPSHDLRPMAIAKLFLHFGWTWIGLIISKYGQSSNFLRHLEKEMEKNEVCYEFVLLFETKSLLYFNELQRRKAELQRSSSKVVLVHGDANFFLIYELSHNVFAKKVWLTTAKLDASLLGGRRRFSGALSFNCPNKDVPEFRTFLQSVTPSKYPNDIFIKRFWSLEFNCNLHPPYSLPLMLGNRPCTGQEKLDGSFKSQFEMDMSPLSYSVYRAVLGMAKALHKLSLDRSKWKSKGNSPRIGNVPFWKLHQLLKKTAFNNNAMEETLFHGTGDLAMYDVLNWILLPNRSFISLKVGEVTLHSLTNHSVAIHKKMALWDGMFVQPPRSACSQTCPPGFQKALLNEKPKCCFLCIECSKGEVSNQTDTDHCVACEEDHYPSEARNQCLPKRITFLSYDEPLGIAVASTAIAFSLFASLVLGIFIKYRDSPIVKANNRHLSYILLSSLMLCFLCSLLFLGQPRKLTCLLSQTAFAVIFSVSLATVLAKTIMVVLAFKVTKPGSKAHMWMRPKVGSVFVLSCSLIQAVICTIWMGISPPLPHADLHSEPGHIILECSKGSAAAFYCMLGYLGLLAMVSFTVAFLARKLPDRFNEAKFITFSIVVFCSVWVSFIPTYLSTKGKYVVAVEIFSILASSAGLFVCIFSPKIYMIVLHPSKNQKEHITSKYFHK